MPNCNTCARKNCRGNIIRDKNGNIKKTKDCPGYIPFDDLKVSLLPKNSEIYTKLQELTGKKKKKNINNRKKFKRVRKNDKNKSTKK